MLQFYEKLENIGFTNMLKKSLDKRNSLLKKCPYDELVCLFFFMNYDEWIACFSKHITQKSFENIPSDDIFTLLINVEPSHINYFMSNQMLKLKLFSISSETFYYEILKNPQVLINYKSYFTKEDYSNYLLKNNVSYDIITEICTINPFYRNMFLPFIVRTALMLPFNKDISLYIMSFVC